jgi:hypothetical protein
MLWHKENLFESDPKKLDPESLNSLRRLLITKLLTVNREQRARYRNVVEIDGDLGSEAVHTLTARIAHIDRLNGLLQSELERLTEPQAEAAAAR